MNDNHERSARLQVQLTEEELTLLDVWRFTRHMPSRAAAVRELLRLGLASTGYNISSETGPGAEPPRGAL